MAAKGKWRPEDWFWEHIAPRTTMSPGAKLVSLCLAKHADWTDFTSWPKASTIGKEIGLHRSSIFPALDQLEAAGVLQRYPIYVDHEQRPSLYLLNCHNLDAMAWTSARQVLESRILAGQFKRNGEVLMTESRFLPQRSQLRRPRTDAEAVELEAQWHQDLELRKSGPGLHLPRGERLHVVGE